MTLENQWEDGVRRVSELYHALPEEERLKVGALCLSLKAHKEAMQSLSARVDASIHCAECGGACCVKGKYHFTGVDLVVYMVAGPRLFVPLFGNGLCPYLTPSGCLMPPGYRPFNCITFNCDTIEDRLTPEEVSRFYSLEREVRGAYAEIRSLFPENSMNALLRGEP